MSSENSGDDDRGKSQYSSSTQAFDDDPQKAYKEKF
jgi:hypothetical protein